MALEHDSMKLESMRKGAKEMGERELHLTRELDKCEQKNKEMARQRKEGVMYHSSPIKIAIATKLFSLCFLTQNIILCCCHSSGMCRVLITQCKPKLKRWNKTCVIWTAKKAA